MFGRNQSPYDKAKSQATPGSNLDSYLEDHKAAAEEARQELLKRQAQERRDRNK